MVPPLERNSVPVRVLRWYGNTIFHQVLAVIAVAATYYGWVNYTSQVSQHVILCTLGYVPLMAESILLFANDNVWTQDVTRKTKYWIHGVLITVGTAALTAGTFIEYNFKGSNRNHFTSDHGLTGIISVGLLLASLVIGLLAGNAQSLNRIARPVWFKFFHNFIGIAGYVIGMISLIYGYYTRWFKGYYSDEASACLAYSTGIITAWSLYAAFISLWNQLKTIVLR